MKILVTGGAGFIGSHVVDGLIKAGHDVVVIDDLSTGYRSNLNPKARFYRLDIRSPVVEQVFESEQPDVVNHHAAQMNVRRSIADPVFDADVNVVGSLRLIEYTKRFGVQRFIYISTGGAVYGEPVYLPCDEDHPVQPICQYGVSKHTVEHYLYLYAENYDLDYTVLRYPNVYGPRQDPYGEAGVVAIFTSQMLRDDRVVINGSGAQERDFVYVGDMVQANIAALAPGNNGIYNLGWGRGTSVNEIFHTLADITGYRQSPRHGPPIVGETYKICLDSARAAKELDWQPTVTLEDGLRETVDYFRSPSSIPRSTQNVIVE